MMVVGVCTIELQVPSSQSLKDKRQVLRSVKARVRNEFNVAIAEVDHLDSWQLATLGVSCVSSEKAHAQGLLQRVVGHIEGRFEVVLLDYEVEFV